jgi:hypothetical protein
VELATTRLAQFLLDATRLRKAEEHFLMGTGLLAGTIKRLSTSDEQQDLVAKGALLRVGEHRYARYRIAIPMRKVSPVVLDERGNFS